jgi:glycerol-3-phosphate dehydrogenase
MAALAELLGVEEGEVTPDDRCSFVHFERLGACEHAPMMMVDDDYYGDLDQVDVRADEVDYLLQGIERVFPPIREYRPVRATTGVRPTLHRWRLYEDDLSRRYKVFDHPAAPGLLTIAGGKLSMYRAMAEEAADAVCTRLGVQNKCSTFYTRLPGSEEETPKAADVAAEFGMTELSAARLLRRHGCRGPGILAEDARYGRVVCRCDALSEAELAFAARHEQVRTLADAFRRVGLASGPCAGAACLDRAAQVVGRELGWSVSQRQEAVHDYLSAAWLGRAPLLDTRGWAQEEMARALRPMVRR